MAANDYYTSSFPPSGQEQYHHNNRTDAPLPPVPGTHSAQSVSPVSSPFDDDNRYEYPPTNSKSSSQVPLTGYNNHNNNDHDTAYHGPNASHSSDPFADQNAIPLTQNGKMDPGLKRYNTDPEARYPQGHEKAIKKKGWLNGRVTWVVYILTTVQIGVFVGELIKMGMWNLRSQSHLFGIW